MFTNSNVLTTIFQYLNYVDIIKYMHAMRLQHHAKIDCIKHAIHMKKLIYPLRKIPPNCIIGIIDLIIKNKGVKRISYVCKLTESFTEWFFEQVDDVDDYINMAIYFDIPNVYDWNNFVLFAQRGRVDIIKQIWPKISNEVPDIVDVSVFDVNHPAYMQAMKLILYNKKTKVLLWDLNTDTVYPENSQFKDDMLELFYRCPNVSKGILGLGGSAK